MATEKESHSIEQKVLTQPVYHRYDWQQLSYADFSVWTSPMVMS